MNWPPFQHCLCGVVCLHEFGSSFLENTEVVSAVGTLSV